jgi:hypothetical protein
MAPPAAAVIANATRMLHVTQAAPKKADEAKAEEVAKSAPPPAVSDPCSCSDRRQTAGRNPKHALFATLRRICRRAADPAQNESHYDNLPLVYQDKAVCIMHGQAHSGLAVGSTWVGRVGAKDRPIHRLFAGNARV